MLIEEISLKDVMVFEHRTFHFKRGFNLILAPNESGKSSLLKAIQTLLFVRASTRKKEVLELKRWGSRDSFVVEGVIDLAGRKYRLVKDFGSGSQEVIDAQTEESIARGREVDRFLKDNLPIPEEQLFFRVCAVRHEELAEVHGASGVGERIERILGGGWGDVSPEDVEKELKSYLRDLVRGQDGRAARQNWGEITKLSEEIDELRQRLEESRVARRKRIDLLKEAEEVECSVQELESRANLVDESIKRADKLEELENLEARLDKEATELQAKLNRLSELISVTESVESEKTKFPPGLIHMDRDGVWKLKDSFRRERELGEKLSSFSTMGVGVSFVLMLISLMAFIGGVFLSVFVSKFFLAMAGAGIVVFALIFLSGIQKRKERKELEEKLAGLVSKREKLFDDISIEEAEELLDRFADWLNRKYDCEARLDELSKGGIEDARSQAKDLDQKLTDIAIELRAIRKEKDDYSKYRLKPEERIKLERELVDIQKDLDSAKERLVSIRTEIPLTGGDDVEALEEELAIKEEMLARLVRKKKVVETALYALQEAREGFAGYIGTSLPGLISRYFGMMTEGRYREVQINPLTLDVTVRLRGESPGEAGDLYPEVIKPETMSQGTRDQLFLSTRLALIELLSSREPLPIILDDPLVHFDPGRREKSLDILLELSKNQQVLFFSCELDRDFPDVYRVEL